MNPPTLLHAVVKVSLFCKWEINFMTCNLTSPGGHNYIIAAIYYFTKWAEAMPTFNCKDDKVTCFFFNHVIARFSVPQKIVSYHCFHFEDVVWTKLSTMLKFKHQFSSSYYPQGNGKVEVVNKIIKTMLERMVGNHKTNWHHMLFSAL